MKGKTALKLAGLLLVLTFVTSPLVAGTYAKYITTVEAKGTVTVAKWVAELDETTGTITGSGDSRILDLTKTLDNPGTADDFIAPGSSGNFNIEYSTKGSQVARNVKIELDYTELTNIGIKFYTGYNDETEEYSGEISHTGQVAVLVDQDYGSGEDGEAEIPIYWQWPFDVPDLSTDPVDTALGQLAASADSATFEVTLTFTAKQLSDEPPTP